MFLSMLVAWMIPDVPRSLREQLKKENMMLMEFLLNQDQEAQAKSHSQKGPNACFPAGIDIIVEEAPAEEHEEEAPGEVEVILNEIGSSKDGDPEVSPPEVEEKGEGTEDINEGEKGIGVCKNEDEKGERGEIKELRPAEEFTVDLDYLMGESGRMFDVAWFCVFSS